MNTRWKTAIYTRISEQEKDSDRNSIQHQTELLTSLASKKELSICQAYCDNGKSGGNFDRPAFNEMLDDIQSGHINCVLVKDLSRFGREHIDANFFIEKLFPRFGVRIITAIEGFDSFEDKARMNSIEVPLINLFNDQYLQQVSNSTKASLHVKMREGKFVGTLEPYAYIRSANDKHRLVIDPSVTENVKHIFNWYLEGASLSGIAKRLNELGIENPSAWRARLHQRESKTQLWQSQHIAVILSNEVYIGDMVQGKTSSPNRKVDVRMDVPRDQWIIVKNTHDPIISRKDFYIVQELMKVQAKPQNTHLSLSKASLFAGILYCSECGKPMKRHIKQNVRSPHDMRYFCSTYFNLGKQFCTSHYILETEIYQAVEQQIKKLLSDLERAVSSAQNKDSRRKLLESMSFKIDRLTNDANQNKRLKNELYIDLKRNIISEAEFADLKLMFDKRISKIESERSALEKELDRIKEGKSADPVVCSILSYIGFERLTRAMVIELIDKIVVDQSRSVKVYFKNIKDIKKYL